MHGIPASFATHAALANQVHKHKMVATHHQLSVQTRYIK